MIDGSKMFTTLAHVADYVFLLTRTNPDVPKHQGLTVFLVPLGAPGVEIRPVLTLGAERTNATFYDGVRVPDANRVGDVDGGWGVMTVSARRRAGGGRLRRAGATRPRRDGCLGARRARRRRSSTTPRCGPGSVASRRTSAPPRLLGWRVVWLQARGEPVNVEASMAKLLGAVVLQRVCEECLDLMGPAGLVRAGDDAAGLADPAGLVEEAWRHSKVTSIYGGTNEVQRNIIAGRGLRLPRE